MDRLKDLFLFFGDRLLKNFCEDLFLESTCACVLGPWLWPRAFLSLASRESVLGKAVLGLGLGFILCPWPWPRALCPRLHLWWSPNAFTGPGKIFFFYLYSDARYSLKFPGRILCTPLILPIYVIMTSFPQKLAKFLALFTFTLFILSSLMIGPEFPNLGHSMSGT